MNAWKIFVLSKPRFADHRGASLKKEWGAAGLSAVKEVRAGLAYEVSGVPEAAAQKLAASLLADPITQDARVLPADKVEAPKGARLAQVWPKGGVADPVADTVRLAARDLKIDGVSSVRSGQVYEFAGAPAPADVRRFCEDRLMNAMVQRVEVL
jgi:phosphoribosylformylglycinamidine (FGAM) synthase PurS component